jgi:hypothetical protein
MTYYFYSINDKTKEAINTVEAPSIEVALDYFAKMKKLSESEFSQIYSIGIKNK